MKTICVLGILLTVQTPLRGAPPLIVAHRGASRDAPENTLPAFRLAWKQGADAIEGDFFLTRDGKIVCLHDRNTKRVAGKSMAVAQATLAELRTLDVGASRGEKFKGAIIPTIAEVFATVPAGKKIYVEIKCGVEILPALATEIKKSALKTEQIVVISFKKDVIREFKAKHPEHKAFWLSGVRKDKSGKATPSVPAVLTTLKQIKADGFSSSKDHIDASFIRAILEQGYEYHVWTVDDPKTAKRFRSWGAQSITTNVPGTVRESLAE